MWRLISSVALLIVLSACTSASAQPWQAEDELNAIDGQTWVVGSHLVTVSPDATKSTSPSVGSTVRVSGQRTPGGELVIDTVEVLNSPAAQPASPTPRAVQQVTTTTQQRAPAQAPAPKKKSGRGGDD